MSDKLYTIHTNLDSEGVNRVGLAIFAEWLSFALGQSALGGKMLAYPTGRYAASLQYKTIGEATVAIIADEKTAPEAAILETGHMSFDMKTRLIAGKPYRMHRRIGSNKLTRALGLRRIGAGPPSLHPRMWAQVRNMTNTGFASFGPNSDPDSWIMPAMPAYAPALLLSRMAEKMAAGMGG